MQSIVSVTDSTRVLMRLLLRQIRFPTLSRCVVETAMFSIVFLVAGHASLEHSAAEMLAPMVPVVLVMMLCSVASGVYRHDINNSIVNIYAHSAYGFVLSSIGFLVTASQLAPDYTNSRFVFFFLFAVFFVTNTLRPLISGTDFLDGGGRRGN